MTLNFSALDGSVQSAPESSKLNTSALDRIVSILKAPQGSPVPDFSKITMNQTMGGKSFTDFPAPDAANIPAKVREGLSRVALYDTKGNLVPSDLQKRFAAAKPILAAGSTPAIAPEGTTTFSDLLALPDTLYGALTEAPARIIAEALQHLPGQAGVNAQKFASSPITPLSGQFQQIFEQSPITNKVATPLAFTASMIADPLNVIGGPASKAKLVEELIKADDAAKAANVLRKARVPEDLIGPFAERFAPLTDKAQVEAGVDTLRQALEKMKGIARTNEVAQAVAKKTGVDIKPAADLAAEAAARDTGLVESPVQRQVDVATLRNAIAKDATLSNEDRIALASALDKTSAEKISLEELRQGVAKSLKTGDEIAARLAEMDQRFLDSLKPGSLVQRDTGKFLVTEAVQGGPIAIDTSKLSRAELDAVETSLADGTYTRPKGAVQLTTDGPMAAPTKTRIIDKLPPVPEKRTPEDLSSEARFAEIATRPTADMPELPLTARERELLDTARGAPSERFAKAEAAARAELEQAKMERDVMRDVVPNMPGKALAKYESKRYPGQLPEILGKTAREIKDKKLKLGKFNQMGDQILDTALGYKEHGWNTVEDAEKALQDYKSASADLKAMEDTVRQKVKNLRAIQAQKKQIERSAILRTLIEYVQSEGTERRRMVQSVQDFFKLTNKEMGKILRNERDIRLMTDSEFDGFLKRIQGKATEAFMRAEAKAELEATIFEKELVKWDNVRKALQMPTIQRMTVQQLKDFNEFLQSFKQGDEFLGVRQIQTVKNTNLAGIHTKREALERLLADVNDLRARTGKPPVGMEDLNALKVGPLDKFRYDVALARQNPLYEFMVHETHRSILNGDMAVLQARDKVDELFAAARASRKRGILDHLIPSDNTIFRWLESTDADKIKLADDMTAEELDAAMYIRDWYAEARDYLVQQQVLKRYVRDYVTHIRRGFLEAWKEEGTYVAGQVSGEKPGKLRRTARGLFAALKEVMQAHVQEEAFFNILNEKTDTVLPLEKFFQFSMTRTGQVVPTKNVARAFLKYAATFEKKKALDSLIPKIDIYVHSLTPKKLTPRGLEFDDSLKRFFKTWMNSKKGRPMDLGFVKPGDPIDWALRTGTALVRMIDLGLNIPVGIASNLGAQAAAYRGLGEKAYALGLKRLATKQGRQVIGKYENLLGRAFYKDIRSADATLGQSLHSGFLALFSAADRKARQIFMLGSMSPSEFRSGAVSSARLADIKLALGRHLPIENMESVVGKTSVGKVFSQYRSWAVPLMSSTLDDLSKMARAIRSGDAAFIKSPEFGELMRTTLLSTIVGVSAYGILTDKRPKKELTFAEKIAQSAARDALSLVGALNPTFWSSQSRLEGFVADLGTALWQIISLEKKQNGDYTAPGTLQRTLVPAAIRQLMSPQTSSAGGTGIQIPSVNIPSVNIPSYNIPSISLSTEGSAANPTVKQRLGFQWAATDYAWANKLAKDTMAAFPFDSLAQGELADTKYTPVEFTNNDIQGSYKGTNTDVSDAAREVVPAIFADIAQQIERGVKKPTIQINTALEQANVQSDNPQAVETEAKRVVAHEMLHRLYDLSPMGLEPGQNADNATTLGMHWIDDWDKLASKYPQLAQIDKHLADSGYDTSNPYSVATERFAYLGQLAIEEDGTSAIPKELRKYYKGVIKFN